MGEVDAELVEAQHRDGADAERLVEELVERHAARTYRLALRVTGVAADAEAVVEDTLRQAVGAPMDPSLGTRIDLTASRAAYRALRARRPLTGEIDLDEVLPTVASDGGHFAPMEDWSPNAEAAGVQGQLAVSVMEALDALPADYRTALVLHDAEEIPPSDVAEVLGLDLSGVRDRVHRARLSVRKRLTEGFRSRAGGQGASRPGRAQDRGARGAGGDEEEIPCQVP